MTDNYYTKQKRKTIFLKWCVYAFAIGGILVLILGIALELSIGAIVGGMTACILNALLLILIYRKRIKNYHQGIDPSKFITNE
ncbi:MAG: hypothetical protein HGN29_10870 [Asgard group archaeon]|nr:hypothetical protein [Asgard group archaeon]